MSIQYSKNTVLNPNYKCVLGFRH